jgi:hypothetical protein
MKLQQLEQEITAYARRAFVRMWIELVLAL